MIHRLPLIVSPPHRRPKFALSGGGAGPEPWFHETFAGGVRTSSYWGGINVLPGDAVVVSSDFAWVGTHSLKFSFHGTPDDDAWAEQRMTFPVPFTEFWLQTMFRVPSNYIHRPGNNKFLTLWGGQSHDDYSNSQVAQFYLSLETQSGTSGQRSRLDIISIHGDDPRNPTPDNRFFGPDFITPDDYGEWLQVRVHARIGNPGLIRVFKNGVMHVEVTDFNMTCAATGGAWDFYRFGYLMGWSNSGYPEQTDFYFDDFRWYLSDPGWG